jgi:hypothetical protein
VGRVHVGLLRDQEQAQCSSCGACDREVSARAETTNPATVPGLSFSGFTQTPLWERACSRMRCVG